MNKIFKLFLAGSFAAALTVAGVALAAPSGISGIAGEHYAWTDVSGWIDFAGVTVDDTNLSGTASALQLGPGTIVMNCASAPVSNCGAPTGSWYVANDGSGNLSGWAWSDVIGWISFCGNGSAGSGPTGGCPASPSYQVHIDTATGDFFGWAWNDVVGWIGFNCNNPEVFGSCATSNYKVKTSWSSAPAGPSGSSISGFDANTWLKSSIFDTQVTGGAAFNTISWQGVLNGGRVGFQIAVSNNAAGPWNYLGPDGSANTVYETSGPNAQLPLDQAAALRRNTNNNRYVRYEIYLAWAGSASPQVDDVVISYSP